MEKAVVEKAAARVTRNRPGPRLGPIDSSVVHSRESGKPTLKTLHQRRASIISGAPFRVLCNLGHRGKVLGQVAHPLSGRGAGEKVNYEVSISCCFPASVFIRSTSCIAFFASSREICGLRSLIR